MIQTKSKSRELDDGTKISLSVCIEADRNNFSESEQQEIIREFGMVAQLLLSELENVIGFKKRKTNCLEWEALDIEGHFGIDDSTDFVLFDSKDLARQLVMLSFLKHGSVKLTIDYDPDYPCGVLEKKAL